MSRQHRGWATNIGEYQHIAHPDHNRRHAHRREIKNCSGCRPACTTDPLPEYWAACRSKVRLPQQRGKGNRHQNLEGDWFNLRAIAMVGGSRMATAPTLFITDEISAEVVIKTSSKRHSLLPARCNMRAASKSATPLRCTAAPTMKTDQTVTTAGLLETGKRFFDCDGVG